MSPIRLYIMNQLYILQKVIESSIPVIKLILKYTMRHIDSRLSVTFNRSSASSIRDRDSIGKIIKNKSRLKTEVSASTMNNSTILSSYPNSLNSSMSRQKIFQRTGSQSKSTFKSQQFMESYEEKLWRYEKNKREILRDIGRINCDEPQKKEDINHSNHSYLDYKNKNKKESFLQCKLKYSLKSTLLNPTKHARHQEESQSSVYRTNNQYYNKASQEQMRGLEEKEKNKFIAQMDKQIRLENKLRKIKLQLKPTDKKYIKEHMSVLSSHLYNLDKLINLSFEQFQFCTDLKQKENYLNQQNVSSETLSTVLMEVYQLCERNWKQNIHRKFSHEFVKNLFHYIHSSQKTLIDFKSFARQFNILFSRNYQPREMFRIYQRIAPFNKSNFFYIFSN